MSEKCFFIEGRGGIYIYHFIVLNLGALYNIENGIYTRYTDSITLKNFNVKYECEKICNFPINVIICIDNDLYELNEWQKNIIEHLKHKINLVKYEDLYKYDIISSYGIMNRNIPYCDNPNEIFPYLRKLFLFESPNYQIQKNKRIYITRKGSEKYHNGKQKRICYNEDELVSMLQKYKFDIIKLDDYNIKDKIFIFQTSEIIISSHSGSLTCCLFANENTKILEILNKGERTPNGHYKLICETLNINYKRYTNIKEDKLGNFNINVNDFETYINNNYTL